MSDKTDIVELAEELAELARTTRDAQTGLRLMKIVDRLLTEAGLPEAEEGGGMPPSRGRSEPVCEPA